MNIKIYLSFIIQIFIFSFINCFYKKNINYDKIIYINSFINKNKKNEILKIFNKKTKIFCNHDKIKLENEFSMNLDLLKKDEEKIIDNLKKRGMEKYIDTVKILKKLINEKNKSEINNNNLKNKKKKLSNDIKNLMFNKDDLINKKEIIDDTFIKEKYDKIQLKKETILKEINEINNNINNNEIKLKNYKLKIKKYKNKLPNILLSIVPDGNKYNDKVIKIYKNIEENKETNENIKNINYISHEKIIKKYDYPIFSNISNKIGFGYNILLNNITKLERALIQFMIDTHTNKFNYYYVKAPLFVRKSSLINTGQLPKFKNELFKIGKNYKILNEDVYLIPTSEVSLLNLFENSLIDYKYFPIKLISHSSCFRNEKKKSYGKNSKGLLREYIFEKVELVVISDKKNSIDNYFNLIKHCEYILKELNIPYRIVLLNSFNTPFSSSICYDIEAWLPSQKRYIEVSSCSNCLDFQARKLYLKLKKNKKKFFCHTINGSGLAIGRILAILIEQYQINYKNKFNKNDKIELEIPEVLRKYMNTSKIFL